MKPVNVAAPFLTPSRDPEKIVSFVFAKDQNAVLAGAAAMLPRLPCACILFMLHFIGFCCVYIGFIFSLFFLCFYDWAGAGTFLSLMFP